MLLSSIYRGVFSKPFYHIAVNTPDLSGYDLVSQECFTWRNKGEEELYRVNRNPQIVQSIASLQASSEIDNYL